jgi:hypothetical protein
MRITPQSPTQCVVDDDVSGKQAVALPRWLRDNSSIPIGRKHPSPHDAGDAKSRDGDPSLTVPIGYVALHEHSRQILEWSTGGPEKSRGPAHFTDRTSDVTDLSVK